MKSVRIAILGATSHIAKGLIAAWGVRDDRELLLYARSPERVLQFTARAGIPGHAVLPVEEFGQSPCDVIVNCIGIGDPGRLSHDTAGIFSVTESWDGRVLHYLAAHSDALYINFSSGAAYGSDFRQPVDDGTPARFSLNHLAAGDYYGIAKLNAEAKHRAVPELNIVDLRVFSYFSRFIDLETKFFLSEVVTCLRQKKTFETGPVDISRDYVDPSDLLALVDVCIARRKVNDAFDVYSSAPVRKFEILDHFSREHGLNYTVLEGFSGATLTGIKDNYYSTSRRAATIGYLPRFTSLQAVAREAAVLLEGH